MLLKNQIFSSFEYKRSFTLIEILLALSLISFLGIFSFIQAKNFFLERAYILSKKTLLEEIQMAKVFSISYHTDLCLRLNQDKRGVLLSIDVKDLPQQSKILIPKTIHLKNLQIEEESMEVHFYANQTHPRREINLKNLKGKEKRDKIICG